MTSMLFNWILYPDKIEFIGETLLQKHHKGQKYIEHMYLLHCSNITDVSEYWKSLKILILL